MVATISTVLQTLRAEPTCTSRHFSISYSDRLSKVWACPVVQNLTLTDLLQCRPKWRAHPDIGQRSRMGSPRLPAHLDTSVRSVSSISRTARRFRVFDLGEDQLIGKCFLDGVKLIGAAANHVLGLRGLTHRKLELQHHWKNLMICVSWTLLSFW